jgi:GntR family transcriptional regulator
MSVSTTVMPVWYSPHTLENRKLDLSIDRDSDVPLATQLAWRLRTLIATGALAPGTRLPAVRELAEAAAVNVNTARGVYGRLEEEGLISSQHGRGTFVSERPPLHEELAAIAGEAAERARRAGVDPRDVAAALFSGPQAPRPDVGREGSGTPTPGGRSRQRDERAHRRELRAEIARVERELAYVEGLSPSPAQPTERPAGRILATSELESIHDELTQRLAQRRQDAEEVRHALMAARARAEAEPEPQAPAPGRVWRPAGVSTRALGPGVAWVVWTSGS